MKVFCGDLLLKSRYSIFFHLQHKISPDNSIPAQFGYEKDIPSIGYFYNNGNGFNFNLSYLFENIDTTNYRLSFDLEYDSHSIKSRVSDINSLFGENISMKNISLRFGVYWGPIKNKSHLRLYINGGPLVSFAKGETTMDKLNIKFDYETTLCFRFNIGADIPVFSPDYGINISASYDAGNINRGKVNYYLNSDWIMRAKPTGEESIIDNRILFSFGIYLKIL